MNRSRRRTNSTTAPTPAGKTQQRHGQRRQHQRTRLRHGLDDGLDGDVGMSADATRRGMRRSRWRVAADGHRIAVIAEVQGLREGVGEGGRDVGTQGRERAVELAREDECPALARCRVEQVQRESIRLGGEGSGLAGSAVLCVRMLVAMMSLLPAAFCSPPSVSLMVLVPGLSAWTTVGLLDQS